MATLSVNKIIEIQCSGLDADPNKDYWVQLAEQQTYECFFGTDYNLAVALRACHMWTVMNRAGSSSTGATGEITSIKEGDLSISYAKTGSKSSNSGDLDQTVYGKQLMDLIEGNGPGISVTGAGLTVKCDE